MNLKDNKIDNLEIVEPLDDKAFLRATRVAELCDISVSKVWELAKDGIFKAYRPTSGITLFKKDEVIKAIENTASKG